MGSQPTTIRRSWGFVGIAILSLTSTNLSAADADAAADVVYPPILVQPGEEQPTTLEPIVPRDAATGERLDALALFMQGKLHERRRELAEALDSFRKAIEKDETAITIYESYIPLAFLIGSPEEAVEAAKRAASLDDDGHELVRSLAALMASTGLADDADQLLTASLLIPRIRDRRIASLLVRRDLATIKRRLNKNAESAQLFKTVFDALTRDNESVDENTTEDDPQLKADESVDVLSEAERKELLGEPGKTYERMGEVFLAAELPDLAVAAFDRASQYQTKRPGLHSYNLATVFRKKGELEKSLEYLDQYLSAQLRSKGVAAYEMLRDLLIELGREEEVLDRLERLVEKDRLNQTLRFFYADQLLDAKRYEDAEKQFKRGLGGGADPRGLVGLLALQRQTGDAAALLDSIIKLYPALIRASQPQQRAQLPSDVLKSVERLERELDALKSDEVTLDALVSEAATRNEAGDLMFLPAYTIGKILVDAGRAADALPLYRRAIELRNEPPAQLYEEIGQALHDAEMYDQAAAIFREAATSTSGTLRDSKFIFYYFLAHSEAFAGNTSEASDAIAEALNLRPDLPLLRFEQAWIPYYAKDWDTAIEAFEKIIDEYSANMTADNERVLRNSQFSLSNIYVQKGDIDKGIEVLEDVLEADPDNVQGNNDLGYLLAENDRELERAYKLIQVAIDAEPDNPAYLDSLGWVLHKLGRNTEAAEPLRRAANMEGGQDSVIFEHLGAVEAKLGNTEAAIAAYTKAIDLESEKSQPDAEFLKRVESALKGMSE